MYATVILRPTGAPAELTPLSIAVGLAICDTVDPDGSLGVGLKWPNDIVSADGKMGGVLIEMSSREARVEHVLVGIGLNLAPHRDRPPGVASVQSHDADAGGDPAELLEAICEALSPRYEHLVAGRPWAALETWQERLWFMDDLVTVEDGPRTYHGVLAGIDESGALLLTTDLGRQRIVAGDLTRGPRPSSRNSG